MAQLIRRNPLECKGTFVTLSLRVQGNQEVILLNRKGVLMAANMAKTPKVAAIGTRTSANHGHMTTTDLRTRVVASKRVERPTGESNVRVAILFPSGCLPQGRRVSSHLISPRNPCWETGLPEMVSPSENRHFLKRILREASISVNGYPWLRQGLS